MEPFWTIMAFAFVLGMGALGGFIGFYWFVIGPSKVLADKHR